ncbi:hypothetical protein C2740_06195 [Polynucleobacter sp. MG-5-Ahmo-C2]|jgi:hypothetical protein|uniref:hypothetical protein n=1 Tax=Polynucleobacter sp. MG-5-Ahmo-C2 TaxID=2081051 RepID=UPI001BFD6371|nr:hypothetical protein [Polynucleobacter sp. MG-5-Ahmo-C2]QWD97952.1 hypothetical protein C2740_06195 [Polynucleobacter sp. MG-5-Ahmo-C2]
MPRRNRSIKILKKSFLLLAILSAKLMAAPFEIKVHDELIAELHQSSYEVETNLYQPSAAQGISSNVFQTRLEYAYGIAHNNEVAVNAFLSKYNGISYVNGGKVGQMYIPTHDEEGIWHYGIKNEIVYLKDIGGDNQIFYEMTPILALQMAKWRFTVNPSVDFGLNKSGGATFAPSGKIAYSVTPNTSIGSEYYSEISNTTNAFPIAQRFNTAYLVLDTKIDKSSINFGIGKGTNLNSDNWVVKLIAAVSF